MRARNVWRILSFTVGLALMAAPVLAGDTDGPGGGNGQGVCEPSGSWLGITPGWGLQWTLVYAAGSHWTGPFTLQFVGDASLGGAFPATAYSPTTGTWVRTGRRTFEYTMITYGLAPDPVTGVMTPVYIGKNTGITEMTANCGSLVSTSLSVAFYAPDQDPFGEDPPAYGCWPDFSPSPAQRITVDPPCTP